LLSIVNKFTFFIPDFLIVFLSKAVVLPRVYSNNPKKDLMLLFKIKDEFEQIINNRALSYGNGEHPKHYLTMYHQFFINNVFDGESVIDIGCGYVSVSRSFARAKQNSKILGIDNLNSYYDKTLKIDRLKQLKTVGIGLKKRFEMG
jgi:tRNA G46 methylase TrmB